MKPEELRIGNIVSAKSPEIKDYTPYVRISAGYLEMYDSGKLDARPVEITTEILEMVGARKTLETHAASYHFGSEKKPTYKNLRLEYVRLWDRDMEAVTQEGFYALYVSNKFWRYVFYLHDLQNVIAALTEDELDVSKLNN